VRAVECCELAMEWSPQTRLVYQLLLFQNVGENAYQKQALPHFIPYFEIDSTVHALSCRQKLSKLWQNQGDF
jgi:hypothetical protein